MTTAGSRIYKVPTSEEVLVALANNDGNPRQYDANYFIYDVMSIKQLFNDAKNIRLDPAEKEEKLKIFYAKYAKLKQKIIDGLKACDEKSTPSELRAKIFKTQSPIRSIFSFVGRLSTGSHSQTKEEQELIDIMREKDQEKRYLLYKRDYLLSETASLVRPRLVTYNGQGVQRPDDARRSGKNPLMNIVC